MEYRVLFGIQQKTGTPVNGWRITLADGDLDMSAGFEFELQRSLGKGAAAEVWLAKHARTGREVALKVFKADDQQAEDVEQFLRETRLVARAAHPHILRVYGYGRCEHDVVFDGKVVLSDRQLYLVSEYAFHGSLQSLLGHLEWSSIKRLIEQVLSGLSRVHGRGIIHLDLKPANILRSVRGALVADFGIARAPGMTRSESVLQGLCGTPNYMAPEQSLSARHLYGPWTDLYAVGCLTVALVTGKPPYESDNLMDVLLGHHSAPIPRLELDYDVPKGVDDWLARMLAKRWNERFQRASEASRHLQRITDGGQSTGSFPLVPSKVTSIRQAVSEPTVLDPTLLTAQDVDDRTLMSPAPTLAATQVTLRGGLAQLETEHLNWERAEEAPATSSVMAGLGGAWIAFESTTLIGREVEKESLWRAFRDTHAQQNIAFYSIVGPAGIGKTALCHWLITTAHEQVDADVLVFTHQSLPNARDGLLGTFRLFFGLESVPKERYAKYIAERLALPPSHALCEDITQLLELSESDDSTMTGQHPISIRESWIVWSRLLAYLASKRPFIVLVDDIQWAADTLAFLTFYMRYSGASPVFAVGTHRQEIPLEGRVAELVSKLTKLVGGQTLPLTQLDDDAVVTWLRDMSLFNTETNAKLVAASSGNPLSIKTLVLAALEDELPERISALFGLDSLLRRRYEMWKRDANPSTVQLLELLSLMGHRNFVEPFQIYAQRLNLPISLSLLDDAVRAQFIEFEREHVVAFTHEKYSQVIVESISPQVYVHLNLELAQAMKADLVPDHERIANYFTRASHHDASAEHWMKAALLHRERTDYPNFRKALCQSAQCLRRAKVSRTDRRWVLLSLHWVLCARVMGKPTSVRARIIKLCDLFENSDDHELKAQVLKERARLERVLTSSADGLPFMARALEAVVLSPNASLRIEIRLNYVELLFSVGAHAQCADHLRIVEEGLDRDRRILVQRPHVEGWFLESKGRLARVQGRHEDALFYAQKSLELAVESMSKVRLTNAYNVLGEAYRRLGHFDKAIEQYQSSSDVAEQFGSIDAAVPIFNQMMIALEIGEVARAEKLVARCREKVGANVGVISELLTAAEIAIQFSRDSSHSIDSYYDWLRKMATVAWGEPDLVQIILPLVQACSESGDVDKGRRFLAILENQNRILKSDSLGSSIQTLARSFCSQ